MPPFLLSEANSSDILTSSSVELGAGADWALVSAVARARSCKRDPACYPSIRLTCSLISFLTSL
jgi:hypothetical protein